MHTKRNDRSTIRSRKLNSLIVAMAVTVPSMAAVSGQSAFADDAPSTSDVEVAAAVNSSPLVQDPVDLDTSGDGFEAVAGELDVSIPVDAGGELNIGSGSQQIGLELPGDSGATAELVGDRVVYSGVAADTTIVAQATQGGAQMVIAIDGVSAPTEYSFALDLPQGGSLDYGPDGSVLIQDAAGELVAVVAAPWATDAVGSAVPTHFTIVGSEVIQTVEHEGFVYPVLADPSVDWPVGPNATLTLNAQEWQLFIQTMQGGANALKASEKLCGKKDFRCKGIVAAMAGVWKAKNNELVKCAQKNGKIRFVKAVPAVWWCV